MHPQAFVHAVLVKTYSIFLKFCNICNLLVLFQKAIAFLVVLVKIKHLKATIHQKSIHPTFPQANSTEPELFVWRLLTQQSFLIFCIAQLFLNTMEIHKDSH